MGHYVYFSLLMPPANDLQRLRSDQALNRALRWQASYFPRLTRRHARTLIP